MDDKDLKEAISKRDGYILVDGRPARLVVLKPDKKGCLCVLDQYGEFLIVDRGLCTLGPRQDHLEIKIYKNRKTGEVFWLGKNDQGYRDYEEIDMIKVAYLDHKRVSLR